MEVRPRANKGGNDKVKNTSSPNSHPCFSQPKKKEADFSASFFKPSTNNNYGVKTLPVVMVYVVVPVVASTSGPAVRVYDADVNAQLYS